MRTHVLGAVVVCVLTIVTGCSTTDDSPAPTPTPTFDVTLDPGLDS